MIHSSLHIENLLKTNNAAKIAAQEIRKTNTRGKWESGWAGLTSTACCILPIFGSSRLLTASWKTNSTLYDITKGCTAFRASVWTLCFFLLSVCFRPCILMFGSILVASMCGGGKKGFQGSEFKGQVQPISFAALTPQINLRLFSFVRNQCFFFFSEVTNKSRKFWAVSTSNNHTIATLLNVKAGLALLKQTARHVQRVWQPRLVSPVRFSNWLEPRPFPAKAINKGGPGSCRSQSRERSLLKQGAQIMI